MPVNFNQFLPNDQINLQNKQNPQGGGMPGQLPSKGADQANLSDPQAVQNAAMTGNANQTLQQGIQQQPIVVNSGNGPSMQTGGAKNPTANLSDFQLQSLVKHYNLNLDPPMNYVNQFGGLDDKHYQNAISQISQANSMQNGNTFEPLMNGAIASHHATPTQANMLQQQAWAQTMDNGAMQSSKNMDQPAPLLGSHLNGPLMQATMQGYGKTPAQNNMLQQQAWQDQLNQSAQDSGTTTQLSQKQLTGIFDNQELNPGNNKSDQLNLIRNSSHISDSLKPGEILWDSKNPGIPAQINARANALGKQGYSPLHDPVVQAFYDTIPTGSSSVGGGEDSGGSSEGQGSF